VVVWGGILVLAYLILALQLRRTMRVPLGDRPASRGTVRRGIAVLSAVLSAILSGLSFFLVAWVEFYPPAPPCVGNSGCSSVNPADQLGLWGFDYIELLLLSVLFGVAFLTLACWLNSALRFRARLAPSPE
jgi:hypothetical protein